MKEALPGIEVRIDGIVRVALVDSGCTTSVIYKHCCNSYRNEAVEIITVSGQRQACEGVASVRVSVPNGRSVVINAYVVAFRPLGFDFILGMNGIEAFGGVTIQSAGLVEFGTASLEESEEYGCGLHGEQADGCGAAGFSIVV